MGEVISATTSLDHPSQIAATSGIRFRWLVAVASSLTFAICYLREFVAPHVPVMSWNDQMLFASDGARIVAGQMPYRDYFQFVTPGADLLYAFLFRHLGLLLWIPNALMVCVAATAVLLMTLAAGKVLRGSFIALPAALTVGFVLFGGLDATHHWFSGLIALIAMLVLFPLSGGSEESEESKGSQDWRIALTGALCGVVASFTQSKGATVTAGF